jgi:(S)-2-hydroxy-acid oxidase
MASSHDFSSSSSDNESSTPTAAAHNTSSSDHFKICSVNDYQTLAKEQLPKALYEYLSSGTDDEQTLQENRTAFKAWYLRPRVLCPVGNLTTAVTVHFNNRGGRINYPPSIRTQSFTMPIFASPAGVHALCDPVNGECATARACGNAGILFGLSQHATRSIEDVMLSTTTSQNPTTVWYQAYILKDRSVTKHLIERAYKAGCKGIFLTVDSVRFGYREVDARNGFDALPPPHRLVNYDYNNNQDNNHDEQQQSSSGGLDKTYNSRQHKSWDQNSELLFDQNVT